MSQINFYTIDLAKNVFELHGYPEHGKRLLRRRLNRSRLAGFFERDAQPGATVVMESCGSAHYWGRWLQARDFKPVLLPPKHVRAFVRGNKTDTADAHALALAWRVGDLHPVPIKSQTQQIIQLQHRMRDRQMAERIRVTNQIRAMLREFGVAVAQGDAALKRATLAHLEADASVPVTLQSMLSELYEEWRRLQDAIARSDRELERLYRASEPCRRLGEIPGVGVITATALIASIPDIHRFKRGRSLAAWLGLTPAEHSSGDKRNLGGITKRGNTHLRTLLIHGARSAVNQAHRYSDATSRWIVQLEARRGRNVAVVALANKNARIVWALLAHDAQYQPS